MLYKLVDQQYAANPIISSRKAMYIWILTSYFIFRILSDIISSHSKRRQRQSSYYVQMNVSRFYDGLIAILSIFFVILLIVAITPLCSNKSQVERSTQPSKSEDPSLGAEVLLPPQFVTSSKPFTFEFIVKNPFAEDVNFDDVRTSCSCSNYKLEDYTVKAGQHTKLKIDIHTQTTIIQPKVIAILLTDSIKRIWHYKLSTTFFPLLRFENESSILNLGEFEEGQLWENSFLLYLYQPLHNQPHQLDVVSPDNVCAKVEQIGTNILPNDVIENSYRLSIYPSNVLCVGANEAILVFHASAGTLNQESTLEVRWNTLTPFEMGATGLPHLMISI